MGSMESKTDGGAAMTKNDLEEWRRLVSDDLSKHICKRSPQFCRLIANGIPRQFRWTVWETALNLGHLVGPNSFLSASQFSSIAKHSSLSCSPYPVYEDLKEQWSGYTAQIEKDVRRTFPGTLEPNQKRCIQNVLQAYAAYHPYIGYCQGMSCIAAVLVVASGSEKAAFYALVQLLNEHGLSGLYSEGMPLLKWLMRNCVRCLNLIDPALEAHFCDIGLCPEMYLPRMLMSLFSCTCGCDQALLLWDELICQLHRLGPAILVYTVIAILLPLRERLISMDAQDVCKCIEAMTEVRRTIDLLRKRSNRTTADILALGSLANVRSSLSTRVLLFCPKPQDFFDDGPSQEDSDVEILPTYTAYQDLLRAGADDRRKK